MKGKRGFPIIVLLFKINVTSHNPATLLIDVQGYATVIIVITYFIDINS